MKSKKGSIAYLYGEVANKLKKGKKKSSSKRAKDPFARKSDSDEYRDFLKDRCK